MARIPRVNQERNGNCMYRFFFFFFFQSFNLWRLLLMVTLYHQIKTSISFWCRQGLNRKSLIQPSETLLVELIGTHYCMYRFFKCGQQLFGYNKYYKHKWVMLMGALKWVMLMGALKWIMLMGVLRVMINNLLAEITHFHPYIFKQFPLWSPYFIFTTFSLYLEKRFLF